MNIWIINLLLFFCSAQYGIVDFKTSCAGRVTDQFNQALSLLYSFEYPLSLMEFNNIIDDDPSCCIAYFMAASTFTHPIWDYIEDDRLMSAQKYSALASNCVTTQESRITPRERAYIDALAVYTNHSIIKPADRLQAYSDAFKAKVYIPYERTDENAAILYGLSLLTVGYYSETEPSEGFPHLRAAGQIELDVIKRNPLSPGALHYAIHSFDQPAMATKALEAARAFQNNSCAVPHAVHMPSHIYSDLGLWADSVASNILSVNLAYAKNNQTREQDWYHGSYFLQFAMLQLAMDCDAKAFVSHFQKLSSTPSFKTHLEAATRVMSHYLVETRDWKSAAEFNLGTFYGLNESIYGKQYIIRFNFMITAAKAILNYPTSSIITSCDAVVQGNKTLLSNPSWNIHQMPYWRLSYQMDVMAALAWKSFRVESIESGIAAMRELVHYQKSNWAPEVGHLWDANEQLAEMFLLTGDHKNALDAYESAIAVYPRRFRSLAGAAECAELVGNRDKACMYYKKLLDLTAVKRLPRIQILGMPAAKCPEYNSTRRPELVAATVFLAREKC